VRLKFVFVGLLLASTSHVFAADPNSPETRVAEGGIYGNLHAGTFGNFDSSGDEDITIPAINVGGKVAHDRSETPWGWQFDSDLTYVDFDWVHPSINDVDGHLAVVDTAAHLTYRPNGSSKLGLFAGYGSITFGVKDTTGAGFDLFDDVGLTKASLTLGTGAIGFEGMTAISDSTWIQGRLGLIDPLYVSVRASDGVTTSSISETDFLGNNLGGMVSASMIHSFNNNFSGRAEATYAKFGITGDSDIDMLNLALTANYTFDQSPFTVAVSGGYNKMSIDDVSSDGFSLGTKLIWSFGGPTFGSTGKTFRSGALGFGI
jgi:hypothetical protein